MPADTVPRCVLKREIKNRLIVHFWLEMPLLLKSPDNCLTNCCSAADLIQARKAERSVITITLHLISSCKKFLLSMPILLFRHCDFVPQVISPDT